MGQSVRYSLRIISGGSHILTHGDTMSKTSFVIAFAFLLLLFFALICGRLLSSFYRTVKSAPQVRKLRKSWMDFLNARKK